MDGSTWSIIAGNEQASFIISHLIEVIQLRSVHRPARQLIVLVDRQRVTMTDRDFLFEWSNLSSESKETVVCTLRAPYNDNTLALQLMRLSLVICLHAQIRGGVLVHGALAERDGDGVILAGPGGIGKTTASQRLMSPWHSMCDDLTLIVRDKQGTFWAHPWPTWSRFISDGPVGKWDVQHAVPLRGIFFLVQAPKNRVEAVGGGQATCLLAESTEQAWRGAGDDMRKGEIQTLRLQCFENICTLTQVVPCYLLHLSLNGKFWRKIENALNPKFESRNPKSKTNSNTKNTKFKTQRFCL